MKPCSLALIIATALCAGSVHAQPAHEDWRTIDTERFRVHYPAEYEEWTRLVAQRLESSRASVTAAVGYDLSAPIDVLVMDPRAAANGSAWPILGRPRIVLWTTPPEPSSAIGDSRDWQEQLVVHETAHILHLMRESRDPLQRVLDSVIPMGPVASESPRWVSEGYATVIEGELTGSGRPFRDFRAAVLRTWAASGRLPSYEALASDESSFMGMSMAYLAGSAYLEWLQERAGADSLQKLWRRMSARHDRTFEDAFAGVFGDHPRDLYARFRAELTRKALNLEQEIDARPGDLVLDLDRRAGPIAVTSNGEHIAVATRPRRLPVSLTIWTTTPDEDEVERRRKEIERMLERDPEDVAPVDPHVQPRRRVSSLTLPAGADVTSLAFLDDETLVMTIPRPDDSGMLHSDIHLWSADGGPLRQITTGADIHSISPDGPSSVVGVRHRFGLSSIVSIDLESGAERTLVPPTLQPMIAAVTALDDGSYAWIERNGSEWSIALSDRDGKVRRRIKAPRGAMIADLAQLDAGSLLATLGLGGYLEIARVDLESEKWNDVTRTGTGAMNPVAAGDRVFYLSLDPDGLDVRSVESKTSLGSPAERVADARFAPVVRVPFRGNEPPVPTEVAIPSSRPYGIGPRDIQPVLGGLVSRDGNRIEGGFRWGDPIGRLELLAAAAFSEDLDDGIRLELVSRFLRLPLTLELWDWDPTDGSDARGGSVATRYSWRDLAKSSGLAAGAGWDDVESASAEAGGFAWIEGNASMQRGSGAYRTHGNVWGAVSDHALPAFDIRRGGASLALSRGTLGVSYAVEAGSASEMGGLAIGGLHSTVTPPHLRIARVELPFLAQDRFRPGDYVSHRVRLSAPVLPAAITWQHIEADGGDDVEVAGLAYSIEGPALRLIGFPAPSIDAGAGYELQGAREGEWSAWLSLRWSSGSDSILP